MTIRAARAGQSKTFFESMLMGMASRPLGGGELSLHAMVSLDPLDGQGGVSAVVADR